jgi:DNA-binding SARP family transcriptional activator/tetratricopeptide (TPR) repeat protein
MSGDPSIDHTESSTWRIQIFSGFRLRNPDGLEINTKSRRMVALLTLLAFQRDFSIDRHTLAKIIFWDVEENHEERLKVLLSRISSRLNAQGQSFLKITSTLVWLDDSLVELDVEEARKVISEIADRARAGKPINQLFEQLGSIVSNLEVPIDTPFLVTAADHLKQSYLQLILTHLVPAVGALHSASVGALLESMNLEDPLSSNICCQLMAIYSGLGDRSSIHRVFSRHEEAISEEYGDVVSKSVNEAYHLALDSEAFPGIPPATDYIPIRPPYSFGFDEFIAKLTSAIESAQPGDMFYLTGCEGAGKTHMLARLWHENPGTLKYSYIDFNFVEEELEHIMQRHRTSDVILIDNFDNSGADFMRYLHQSNNSPIIVLTGRTTHTYPGITTLRLPRLSAGNRLEVGSAIALLRRSLEMDATNFESNPDATDLKYYHQIAVLTGGIPGALINCAQTIRTFGVKSALNYVQSELSTISAKRLDASAFSLRTTVLSRVLELNEEQLLCCQLLAKINAPIFADLVNEACEIPLTIFDDLIQQGFVSSDSRGLFKLEPSVFQVMSGYSIGAINPAFWQDFCDGALLWLSRRAESISQNLDVADSFDALVVVCESLMQRNDPQNGVEMFCLMSKWFPSVNFPKELALQAESLIVSQPAKSDSDLIVQVCALSGAFFHKGIYSKMLGILQWGKNSINMDSVKPTELSRLYNNLGLASRCVEDYKNARVFYEQALGLSTDVESLVKLNFNLGCLAEASGDYRDGLSYYELAASSYTANTDYRLLAQNTLSILRLRNRFNADPSISEDLIVDLFKESQSARDRRSQATIILEIGEMKFSGGQDISGIYYMIIGTLLSLQLEYSKNTISKFGPTLAILCDALRKNNQTAAADKLEVISLGMADHLRDDEWNADGKDMLPTVLREILLQCLKTGVLDSAAWPTELDHIIEENKILDYTDFTYVPVIPFIESLRAKFKLMSISEKSSEVAQQSHEQTSLDGSRN